MSYFNIRQQPEFITQIFEAEALVRFDSLQFKQNQILKF
jgi:hypothetical protein